MTIGVDGELRIWNTVSGKEIARFIMMEDGEWIVLTSSGLYNGSEHAEKHLHLLVNERTEHIDTSHKKLRNADAVIFKLKN